jgi:hypothetical protein
MQHFFTTRDAMRSRRRHAKQKAPCSIVIRGTNLGLRNSVTGPEPQVLCGDSVCQQLIITDSSRLQCVLPLSAVERCSLVVSLNTQNSSGSVSVDRLCGEGRYGAVGGNCGPCPNNAECVALFPVGHTPPALPLVDVCTPGCWASRRFTSDVGLGDSACVVRTHVKAIVCGR